MIRRIFRCALLAQWIFSLVPQRKRANLSRSARAVNIIYCLMILKNRIRSPQFEKEGRDFHC